MIIAYLRISTGKQFLSNQQEEIRRYAESRNWVIDQWVTEVASGSRKGSDRKLGALLQQMKRGDTLIVTEVSRLIHNFKIDKLLEYTKAEVIKNINHMQIKMILFYTFILNLFLCNKENVEVISYTPHTGI